MPNLNLKQLKAIASRYNSKLKKNNQTVAEESASASGPKSTSCVYAEQVEATKTYGQASEQQGAEL
jgi:hypothetical protein